MQVQRIEALLSAVLMSVLLAGCVGSARVNMKTDVLSPDGIDQEMVIRGEGMIGEAMVKDLSPDNLRRSGWDADLKREGSSYSFRAAKRLTRGEYLMPGGSTLGSEARLNFDLQVTNNILDREYRLSIVLPPSATPTPVPNAQPSAESSGAQIGQQLAAAAFSMSWTVNLPGEIVETNADSRTNTGGTWEFTLDRLTKGAEIRLVSRERRNVVPFVLGGFALLALGAGLLWVRRRRKRSQRNLHRPTERIQDDALVDRTHQPGTGASETAPLDSPQLDR